MPDAGRATWADGDTAHVVLALFPTAEAAMTASDGLRGWDEADRDVRRGAFGTIRLVDGEPVTTLGTDEGRGRWTRALLALLARSASPRPDGGGPARRAPRDVGELGPAVVARLHADLALGHVALAVVCDVYEHEAMRTKLRLFGGDVHTLRLPAATLTRLARGRDGGAV